MLPLHFIGRRLVTAVLLSVLCTCTSTSFAQIFYEPVRYQYGDQCNVYYYDGADARVHALARFPAYSRRGGFAFASAGVDRHREVCTEPPRVFLDSLPYRNAAIVGATASDAANEANAKVPLYFRKRDLLASAIVLPDGSAIVPAQIPLLSQSNIRITPSTPGERVLPFPREPRPILIIPIRPGNPDASPAPARL